jgi:nitroreductase
MDFSQAIRERCSTRHYDERRVEHDLVAAIIEEAAWAPSAGNVQPWQVVVLSGRTLHEFVARFEPDSLDLLLPGAKLALLEAAAHDGRQVDIAEQDRRMIESIPMFALSPAPPSHILIVYQTKPGIARKLSDLRHSASIAWLRFRGKKRLSSGLRYLWLLLSGWSRLFGTARSVRMASLNNYAYALTLCAHDRGIASCIIGSFMLAGRCVGRSVGLRANQEIAAVVALGYRRAEAVNPVDRRRWTVDTRWAEDEASTGAPSSGHDVTS